MARVGTIEGLREFERDLPACVDAKVVHKRLVKIYSKEIIKAVIASAHHGKGPGDKQYPAYSPAYKKRKDAQGKGIGNWLRGLSTKGDKGGLLDEKNFELITDAKGDIWLIWTAANEAQAIYGEVHNNGIPPQPQREFVHFMSIRTMREVWAGYEQAAREIAAEFSAGRAIR
ncbi:MAG: hypothetical protein KAV00_06805 [Phycisphaerae bacterium]|nr:hypothetical protein [Phycisphaerae bacterium]